MPKAPVVKPATDFVMSSRTGGLNPTLTEADITAALNVRPVNGSDDGKVTLTWRFTVDGVRCEIWDYKGSRWSTFGPAKALAKVFPGQLTY